MEFNFMCVECGTEYSISGKNRDSLVTRCPSCKCTEGIPIIAMSADYEDFAEEGSFAYDGSSEWDD